jgi:hypothetical protein
LALRISAPAALTIVFFDSSVDERQKRSLQGGKVITDKTGEAAAVDIESWANRIAHLAEDGTGASVYPDADSSTYVIRLARKNRVLLFRLSEAQVRTPGREEECEKTLRRKIKDLQEPA